MIEAINEAINNMNNFGPLLACIFIVLESMIPILPLCVFIVINFLAFGNIIGLLISWAFTILGCFIAFTIVRKGIKGWFNKRVRKIKKVNKLMKVINKFKFQQIVVILAIPFTPAFAVNIAAALSDINPKKYFCALIIGKIFMVYFWGYIGMNFIECLATPIALIKIAIMLIIAYIISYIVNKKFDLG